LQPASFQTSSFPVFVINRHVIFISPVTTTTTATATATAAAAAAATTTTTTTTTTRLSWYCWGDVG